ncbi:MAG TPA: DUF4383 domain-containing protein [Solirubrobacterales bacterium]
MEAPSPARLYAAAVGAFLVAVGIAGFFYSASFGGPGTIETALGVLRVNAWLNLLYGLCGALGLLLAASVPRAYALAMGFLFTGLAVWGWSIGSGSAILGFLPAAGGDEALALLLGVLGLLAAAGTPAPERRRRRRRARSKARAKPARQRA